MQALVDAPYILSLRPPLLHNSSTAPLPSPSEGKGWVFGREAAQQHSRPQLLPPASSGWECFSGVTHSCPGICIFSTPQTPSQDDVVLLKTFQKWNQRGSDRPSQSPILPTPRWIKISELQCSCVQAGWQGTGCIRSCFVIMCVFQKI